jgi:hypothetical protein
MERLAKKNAAPEATEGLMPGLLSELNFKPKLEDQYVQRLRHGLYQYYVRHYRPNEAAEQI